MTRKIAFDATKLENLGQLKLRTSHTEWLPEDDSFEYHDTSEGPQIIGKLVHEDTGATKLGMWYKNGEPAIGFDNFPTLELWTDEPESDVRDGFVNIYRSRENGHGWTVGSNTYASEDDAIARGQRNTSGNYIATVKLSIDITKRNNA